MIRIVFGSLDADHDLITGLYDIGCPALHAVFTYPVWLKFGTADLLFGEENVNAYYLEYDDERSGGFAPLAKVSGDKKVVLGLVTTKTPALENKELVINRIHEAAKYVPLDRLYLSPQCGFASCEIGNKLTEEEQWAKLKLVKEIAEEVWG